MEITAAAPVIATDAVYILVVSIYSVDIRNF